MLTAYRSAASAAAGAASAAATAASSGSSAATPGGAAASAGGASASAAGAAASGASAAASGASAPRRHGTFPGVDSFMGRDDATSRAAEGALRELFHSYVDESDDEDGESSKLRRCEPGKVTTKADWREAKEAAKAAKEAAVIKKLEATYKEYERVRGVISNAAQLPEVADAIMLKDRSIEMRSCKKPASGKKKAYYVDEASAVFGQECRLALGSVPEGFAAWSARAAAAVP